VEEFETEIEIEIEIEAESLGVMKSKSFRPFERVKRTICRCCWVEYFSMDQTFHLLLMLMSMVLRSFDHLSSFLTVL